MTLAQLAQRPTAFLPIAMSLAAVAVIAGHIMIAGTAPQADEGTAAHLWQLLMAGQLPVIGLFAIKWLARDPKMATGIITLQVMAMMIAIAPIFILHW